jgi:hypothetical protein
MTKLEVVEVGPGLHRFTTFVNTRQREAGCDSQTQNKDPLSGSLSKR